MLRKILAQIAGIGAAFLLVFIIEMVAQNVWPPPPGLDPKNPESVRAAMLQMPIGALLSVAVAWIVAAFGGAWLASRIACRLWPAYVVGGLVALASVSNLLTIPHPFWFWIVAILLVPLAAHIAGKSGSTRSHSADEAKA